MFSALVAGMGFGLFMAISVGPTIFAIIKYSITYGHRAGISFILGVFSSDALYILLANTASAWLAGLLQYKNWIGYIGSLLFIIMGLIGFLKKIKIIRTDREIAPISKNQYFHFFSNGFLMNAFNPGVIITWITAVAAISTTGRQYRFIFFTTCLAVIVCFDLIKVFLAKRLREKLTPRTIVYLNWISSGCLLLLGAALFIKIMFNLNLGFG